MRMKHYYLYAILFILTSCFIEPKKDIEVHNNKKKELQKRDKHREKIVVRKKNNDFDYLKNLDGKYPFEVKLLENVLLQKKIKTPHAIPAHTFGDCPTLADCFIIPQIKGKPGQFSLHQ